MFVLCFVMHYLVCFFAIHLDGGDRAGCVTLIVCLMSCDCWCSMAPPHSAIGWSAVCDCVFLDQTHLLFS